MGERMCRDFIISSVYLAGDDVPEGDAERLSVRLIMGEGARLVDEHRHGATIDLAGLERALHTLLGSLDLTVTARGVICARTLAELKPRPRATFANMLAQSLTELELQRLGASGILALLRALRADATDRSEHVVERLAVAMARLAPVEAAQLSGTWVIRGGAERFAPGTEALAERSLASDLKLKPQTVVLLQPFSTEVPQALLIEHYRLCAEVLPEACREALRGAMRAERTVALPQTELVASPRAGLFGRAKVALERALSLHPAHRLFQPG